MLEKMEVTSIGNAKVSDSAYSNGYSNSQSQNSSDGSVSRNSNRSNSSGYCGRQTFSFSNEALPQPISKRKDNEHKKKQSKTTSAAANIELSESFLNNTPVPPNAIPYTIIQPPTQPSAEKSEKTTIVELVDVTDPGKHNTDFISDPEAGFVSQSDAQDDPDTQIDEGFCVAISMHDGTVIHVTPTIYTSLGFSKESWIGSSFIDFIHPKYRASFADRIIGELLSPHAKRSKGFDSQQASLFCALRRFKPSKRNDTTDNAHRDSRASLQYLPFRLILTFKTFQETSATEHPQPEAVFLVIAAQPVHSAYKAPEETIISSKFTTRHTATCHLSHVDTDVIQYFGYLPQDMVGRSLFDFYHPEDLPFIKDIYETVSMSLQGVECVHRIPCDTSSEPVMKSEGSSFRSKPYRFAVQNGGYVVLETEWSSFINPWSRKLEFVVGQHRVLKGPANPDVFQPADECDPSNGVDHISEEVMKESKIIQSEIRALLDQSISKSDEYSEQNSFERCKELASFMENLQQGVKTLAQSKDAAGVDRGFSEHDSVMLCKMSHHHEYYDSKSSTETPPSYNQLNYNDNLERFFKSKPLVTTMYCSDEENVNSSTPSNDEAGKSSPVLPAENCTLALNESGASRSRSGTAESLSNSPVNRNNPSTSDASNFNATSNETFKPPILTKSLLSKHNEDMEKQMMQMHRERRSGIKNNDKMTKSSRFKRSGSPSREARNAKISKYEEAVQTTSAATMPTNNGATSMSVDQKPVTEQNTMSNTIRPPLSITVTSSLQPCITAHNMYPQAISRFPVQVIPMYCFPVPHGKDTSTAIRQDKLEPSNTPALQPLSQSPYIQYVATGMAGVLYPPVAKAPVPTAATYSSFLASESSAPVIQEAPCSAPEKSADWKKVLSPGELLSSCVSVDGGCSSFVDPPTTVNAKVHRQIDCNSDESSCSSFCSTTYRNTSSDSSYTSNQRIPELSREKTRAQDGSCKHAYEQEEQPRQEQQQKHHQQQQNKLRKKEPPWLEGVSITPELIYEYQLRPRTLSEILQSDRDALKKITQPASVNNQLDQLYLDLEFEGFEAKLMLEDSVTSNGSESDAVYSENDVNDQSKRARAGRHMAEYHKLAMIHEENAPFPPIQTFAS